jgi:hypothetical protein
VAYQADIGLALLAGHANANTTEDIVGAAAAPGGAVGLIKDATDAVAAADPKASAVQGTCCLKLFNCFFYIHVWVTDFWVIAWQL